jgi:hypothetical protein
MARSARSPTIAAILWASPSSYPRPSGILRCQPAPPPHLLHKRDPTRAASGSRVGVSKLDHAADPRVRKERAAARAVNSETPAAYEVLHQPREATIRPLTGQEETAGQGRDRVLTPVGCGNSITLLTWEFTGRLATPQWASPRLGECVLRLVQRMGFTAELEDATRPRTRRCRTAGQGRGRVLTPHTLFRGAVEF